jgi:acetoin utilization protein AcuB
MKNFASNTILLPTSEIMSKHLITVHVEDSIRKAHQIMVECRIRHLPVIDDTSHVVGILSDRDVKRAMIPKSGIEETAWDDAATEFLPQHKVSDFMSWPVKTIEESCPVLDTAKIMLRQKLSSMLVIPSHEENRANLPKGIVTTDDMLKLLICLLDDKESGGAKKRIDIEFLNHIL